MSSIWQIPEVLCFVFSITISGDSASYFLETNMLISLKGTLTQTGLGIGSVTLPSKGPMRGQYVFLMAKFQIFDGFCFQLVFWRLDLYFPEMIMLISFVSTLTQTTMGVGRVTFPSKGPIGDQYVFFVAKSQSFICVIFSNIISGGSTSCFIEIVMLISFEYILTQTRFGLCRVTLPSKGPMRGQYVFVMTKSQSFYRFS